MIFSRFFAPSHTSNNPDIRLKAIEKLSPDSPNEKRILHELAFNDDDERVSLAALEKLDAFALWLKMSQIARNTRLRSAAQAKVECALIDGSQQLSAKEAKEYLLKSAPSEQIVRCLPLMTELHEDSAFIVKAISRVGRSAFYLEMLTLTPSVLLKHHLIEHCSDIDVLQKALKKCRDSHTASAIKARLDEVRLLAQRPVELSRDCTLTLSKMQALLDKSDFPTVEKQFSLLQDEYTSLSADFHCLDETTRESFEQKYSAIADKLSRHLARLEGPWREAQQAVAHQQAKERVATTVETVKQYHQKLQGEQLLSLSLGEVSEFQKAVEAAESAIEALQAYETPAEEIESLLESYRHIWDGLPTLQRQVTELQVQLKDWQARAESTEEQQSLDAGQIKQAWAQATSDMAVVPVFLQTQWKTLNNTLSAHKRKAQARQQSDLKLCRKYINIIDNLVSQGKFNAAMVKFSKLSEIYQALPDATRQVIDKRYQQTEAEIARLEGWQNYIAAPRKPQLIEQAQALVSTDDTDMPGRAKAVKVLRQQWQSLGSTGTADDEALNTQFDTLLEEAFAPCRTYFAELEAAQLSAAEEREQLIAQLTALVSEDYEPLARYQRFEQLKKQWQQAPQTDAERYNALRKRWDGISEQVNELLSPWIQHNREQKTALVEQAELLSSQDDAAEACEQAKSLQQQWKQVGPAGKRVESKLWFAFKAANDVVFGKAKAQQQQARSQQRSVAQQWQQSLDTLSAEIEQTPLPEHQQAVIALGDELASLAVHPKERKALGSQLSKVKAVLDEALLSQLQDSITRQVDAVVESLGDTTDINESLTPALAPDLPVSWWKGQVADNENDLQHDMLMLEVLAQQPSPTELESQRSTVQLQLMQSKLNGSALPDTDALIARVIASSGQFDAAKGEGWQRRLQGILSYYAMPALEE